LMIVPVNLYIASPVASILNRKYRTESNRGCSHPVGRYKGK